MINPIQYYSWGSATALAELQQRPASDRPEAELWMGAHPVSPSSLKLASGELLPLSTYLARSAGTVGARARALQLPGEEVVGLPFLLKILAIEKALSIQTHPDRAQARAGFDREEQRGIPRTAFHRNYRDANHKPELVCALTPFQGLCGFRPVGELAAEFSVLFREKDVPAGLRAAIRAFTGNPAEDSWKAVFLELLRMQKNVSAVSSLLQEIGSSLSDRASAKNRYWWVQELLRQYPEDPGALAPLYLNLLELEPGDAVFLPAGVPHAYLQGTAVEIMANSDNVLRSGCTTKHVDAAELARVVRFKPYPVRVFRPTRSGTAGSDTITSYPTDAEEFELTHLSGPGVLSKADGPAIVLNVGSPVSCADHVLQPGRSLFVDHETDSFSLSPWCEMERGISVFIASLPGSLSIGGDR